MFSIQTVPVNFEEDNSILKKEALNTSVLIHTWVENGSLNANHTKMINECIFQILWG